MDYHERLGVSRDATAAEINKARRELAKLLHPDRNPDNPTVEEKMKAVNEAADALLKRLVEAEQGVAGDTPTAETTPPDPRRTRAATDSYPGLSWPIVDRETIDFGTLRADSSQRSQEFEITYGGDRPPASYEIRPEEGDWWSKTSVGDFTIDGKIIVEIIASFAVGSPIGERSGTLKITFDDSESQFIRIQAKAVSPNLPPRTSQSPASDQRPQASRQTVNAQYPDEPVSLLLAVALSKLLAVIASLVFLGAPFLIMKLTGIAQGRHHGGGASIIELICFLWFFAGLAGVFAALSFVFYG